MDKALQQWENRIGRRLKLRDLHILSAVVQWGGMAKAATHLAMSQPAVSEAIANLETPFACDCSIVARMGSSPPFTHTRCSNAAMWCSMS